MLETNIEIRFPLVALRDVVVFPEFVVPLFIGRPKSIKAIEIAIESGSNVIFVTQNDPVADFICSDDLHDVGTVGYIEQIIKLTDGTVKILANGLYRAKIQSVIDDDAMMFGNVVEIKEKECNSKEVEGLAMAMISNFENFFKQSKRYPSDILSSISSIENLSKLCDSVASYLPLKISERQTILKTSSVKTRLKKLIYMIEEKSELFIVEKKIKNRVKKQVEKNQKEYYLNEQLKAIYKELGDVDVNQEIKTLEKKIKKSHMSTEAKEKAFQELKKLKNMPSLSQEGGIIRSYIDCLLSIPWEPSTKKSSMEEAEKILSKSHFGIEKIKERIMEYLAVQKRVHKMKAQIMCFVGPPGVGKTSLGKAIAEATKKEFVRVSLGGVNDEAEIRGHRRTYVGAMPGKIILAMKKAKITNPVIMLDEIDKLGSDWRGDPASALLEVLDPEQNSTFVDHYMEVPYDLSETMFITTANTLNIPHALLDRMEIINITGYMEEEKLEIAKKYIVPKQMQLNGLKPEEISISDDAILKIIKNYTMESGVRNLEREISKVARKAVRKLSTEKKFVDISDSNVSEFLGIEKYSRAKDKKKPRIGVVNGLAWTATGGEILEIEAVVVPGSGNIISTGKLGDVMQESIKTAYSYIKSQYDEFGIEKDIFSKIDIHVHVPEGAVPKDGPSAGITVCTAIISALTKKPISPDIAMTGEITLLGDIIAIGGLREKLMAARRKGIIRVLVPEENKSDVSDLPSSLSSHFQLSFVENISNSHLEKVIAEGSADSGIKDT